MAIKNSTILGLALLLALVITSGATAGEWSQERDGFALGFNLGLGTAGADWAIDGSQIDEDRGGGGGANVRLGWAVRNDLVIGLEFAGWLSSTDVIIGNAVITADTALRIFGPSITWYPQGGGFYLRGMIGGAAYQVDFKFGDADFSVEETGGGGVIAAGYEWRLTRTFALGLQADAGFLNVGDVGFVSNDTSELKANFLNATVAFNWFL